MEEEQDDDTCPYWITNTGYIVILHLDGDTVKDVDLYNQDLTLITIRSNS